MVFLLMFTLNSFYFMQQRFGPEIWFFPLLSLYGILMLVRGQVKGTLSFLALFWLGERSWLVWLPAAFVLLLLGCEFLFPH